MEIGNASLFFQVSMENCNFPAAVNRYGATKTADAIYLHALIIQVFHQVQMEQSFKQKATEMTEITVITRAKSVWAKSATFVNTQI